MFVTAEIQIHISATEVRAVTALLTYTFHITNITSIFHSFLLSYSDRSLPNYCSCRGILLHLITLIDMHARTHTHTHRIIRLWMSDRPVAKTSTWQHTTLTTEIRAPNPSKRAATDQCLRPRGHCDRHKTLKISESLHNVRRVSWTILAPNCNVDCVRNRWFNSLYHLWHSVGL